MQILTVFALKKFGNSKLIGCEGFFSLDSLSTGGLFEGSWSFTSYFNAVLSFQKQFVSPFSIWDQKRNYTSCSKDLSGAADTSKFARESYQCMQGLEHEPSPVSCLVLHESLQKWLVLTGCCTLGLWRS